MDAFSTVEVIVAYCQVPTSFLLSPSGSRARFKGEPTDARSAGPDRGGSVGRRVSIVLRMSQGIEVN